MAKKIAWEYCECGCHGSAVTIDGVYYWYFWDVDCTQQPDGSMKIREGKFYLSRDGQMFMGTPLGEFESQRKMEVFLRQYIKEQSGVHRGALLEPARKDRRTVPETGRTSGST